MVEGGFLLVEGGFLLVEGGFPSVEGGFLLVEGGFLLVEGGFLLVEGESPTSIKTSRRVLLFKFPEKPAFFSYCTTKPGFGYQQ